MEKAEGRGECAGIKLQRQKIGEKDYTVGEGRKEKVEGWSPRRRQKSEGEKAGTKVEARRGNVKRIATRKKAEGRR